MSKKDPDEDYSYRHGSGIRWKSTQHSCLGLSVTTGFTRDDLDTKQLDDAKNKFESLFITVRKVLEEHESSCLDSESERLTVCQALADRIHSDRRSLFDWKVRHEIV